VVEGTYHSLPVSRKGIMKPESQMTIEAPAESPKVTTTGPVICTTYEPASLAVQEPQQLTPATPMDLLALALKNNSAIDVIERLAALQERQRDYQAKVSFDEALNRCQTKISRIAADADNPQTHSKYASYAKLDRVVRPVYTEEGFSLSFGEKDCPIPGKTRFVAYLSREGITREYVKDLTPSTKGPKGNDVMTPIHADGSADSYAKRYLVKNIFNVAVGELDNDGNGDEGEVDKDWLTNQIEDIGRCETLDGLNEAFRAAGRVVLNEQDIEAYRALNKAKNARKRELQQKGQ
jgi:ERF superfamily